MRRRENALERKVVDFALHRLGVPSIKMEPPKGSETGWPDRCFFIPGGVPLLLEFKEVGYTPEPKQEYIHDMLEGLGYDVAWTDSYQDAIEAIGEKVERGRALLPNARS